MANSSLQKSWYARILGRSFISIVFGNFFESRNNAAALIGLLLVLTLCYVIVFEKKHEYITPLLNIVFVVIGYYFGSKRSGSKDEDEQTT